MSDHRITEDRAYARHPRRKGAILIVGTGTVGSLLADELARLGISPLVLIDLDVLEQENIVRHRLGAPYISQPKALALADYIRREFPLCETSGLHADFLELSEDEQLQLVRQADVVVAATDSLRCQRRINEVCLEAQVAAVYPSVWAGPGTDTYDAEVGEILWVLAGRHTPCYMCLTSWRPNGGTAEARGGTRADIMVVVLATTWVIAGLLNSRDERAQILDEERTYILVHGFMPAQSKVVASYFNSTDVSGLLNIRVPFPADPCPACGGWETVGDPEQQEGGGTDLLPPDFIVSSDLGGFETAATLRGCSNLIGSQIQNGGPGRGGAIGDLTPWALDQIIAELQLRRVISREPVILKHNHGLFQTRTAGRKTQICLYPVPSHPDTAVALRRDTMVARQRVGDWLPGERVDLAVLLTVIKTQRPDIAAFEPNGYEDLVPSRALREILRASNLEGASTSRLLTRDLQTETRSAIPQIVSIPGLPHPEEKDIADEAPDEELGRHAREEFEREAAALRAQLKALRAVNNPLPSAPSEDLLVGPASWDPIEDLRHLLRNSSDDDDPEPIP